jgi:hypothetical protein
MTAVFKARRRKRWIAAAAAAVLVLAGVAWYNAEFTALSTHTGTGSASGNEPRPIAGGAFEASGVVSVAGTNQLLFVDDGRTREIFVMEISDDRSQRGAAQSVSLDADVTDLEGITSDGRYFYAVGSQSKKTGFEGDGLVRFAFDPATRRVAGMERIRGLKAWLAANVAELGGSATRAGDEALNIEGLAWDPRRRRLLLGLRAPVVNGMALVIPIALVDSTAAFTRENLRVDGATMRVQLGGAGIRSLEYDDNAAAFRIIAGAGANAETRDFRLLEWDGQSGAPTRELMAFDRRVKPEGITRATLGGKPVSVIVFDVGRYVVVD